MLRLLLLALVATAVHAQPVPDDTFGNDGLLVLDSFPNVTVSNGSVAPDGTIFLGGTERTSETASQSVVVRLQPSGVPDPSFGSGGIARFAPPLLPNEVSEVSSVTSIVVLADGRLFAAGRIALIRSDNSPLRRAYATVFDRDGRVDTTYGRRGFTPLPAAPDGSLIRVAIDTPDGVTLGYAGGTIARLTPSGVLDPTFSGDGFFPASTLCMRTLYDMALGPNGRIVAVGDNSEDICLVGVTRSGVADSTFGTNGVAKEDLFGEFDTGSDIVLLPDGGAYVSGLSSKRSEPGDPSGIGVVVYKILPDGTPDLGFGFEGWTWTATPPTPAWARTGRVGFPASGEISAPILGGAQTGIHILGLDPSGAPASSYGPTGMSFVLGQEADVVWQDSRFSGEVLTLFGYRSSGTRLVPVVARLRYDRSVSTEAFPSPLSALSVAPNPMRASAQVSLALDAPTEARITVVDALGRTVATLADARLGVGEHTFALDAARLPAGVYAVVARLGAEQTVRRVTVVR